MYVNIVGRDSSVGAATHHGLDGPGIESRCAARFSAPVHTSSGAHPASYTIGTGSLPGVKRPGRDADHAPQSSTKVKERVVLYIFFPLWAFLACSRVNFMYINVVNQHDKLTSC